MNEFLNGWKWDVYHIGAVLFVGIILWRVITLAIESHNINKKKSNGKR
jgi:hypothetical protein